MSARLRQGTEEHTLLDEGSHATPRRIPVDVLALSQMEVESDSLRSEGKFHHPLIMTS